MDSNKEVTHLTSEERRIIETGIRNGSTKTAIAKTIGKDNSTVGKEIKLHRKLKHKCFLPRECSNYKHCKYKRACFPECEEFRQFTCKRRDRSPGACNGCKVNSSCRFDKYYYDPAEAEHEYKMMLVDSRSGYNITTQEAKALGEKIQPLLKQGLSPYAILQAHPEIDLSEKTLYTYIENKVFEGLADIGPLDLRRQVNRKMSRKKASTYKKREDRRYLIGRTYKDYQAYMAENPDKSVNQMDTVYNDVTNGPFIQTFKFVDVGLLFALYHEDKTTDTMKKGVDQLETILGTEVFRKYTHVLLTDRGGEFAAADAMETGTDGLRRTRVFYCDPMQSGQKGTLENNHIELRYILPHEVDFKQLGLVDQDALNTVLSHVNSIPIEKFGGRTPFDIAGFMYPDLYEKLIAFGLRRIPVDDLILKPSLLKDRRPAKKKKHAGGRKPKISAISPREVAQLTAEGHSPKEIAERMGVSIATYYRRFPAKQK